MAGKEGAGNEVAGNELAGNEVAGNELAGNERITNKKESDASLLDEAPLSIAWVRRASEPRMSTYIHRHVYRVHYVLDMVKPQIK